MKELKRNIAIVCGGDSSEHDVSMRSAQGIYSFSTKNVTMYISWMSKDRTGTCSSPTTPLPR